MPGSFLFTTMWVYLLGSPLVGKTVTIPYLQLTLSLASFTVPLLIGVGIKFKWPKAADKIRRISKPFFLILLIIFPVVGLVSNANSTYITLFALNIFPVSGKTSISSTCARGASWWRGRCWGSWATPWGRGWPWSADRSAPR